MSTASTNTKTKVLFAKTSDLFPFVGRELPEVPAPATPLIFSGTLDPYSGAWGHEQAAHLLRRTGFGPKKSELDLLLSLGNVDDAVAQILNIDTTPPAPPINNYNNPDLTDPDIASGDTWVEAPYNGDTEGYRIESWRGWWYDLMLTEEASVREKMTMFWHNHFATQTELVFWARPIYEHNALLRAGSLGNFKQLVKDVTKNAMMLFYLNGYLNSKDAPDENYARELQELFTIGKDNPNHYTEDDVVAAARVLTGWRINFDNAQPYFAALEHDFTDKQFSSFYNNTVVAGTPIGDDELDSLLNMIFARPEVAEYICRKIYRWFVYYNIDATTEANIIQPLAQILRDNNYEISPVLETLFKSEHFYEANQAGGFIKTPVDLVLGTLRSFNLTLPGTTLYDHFVMQYVVSYFLSNAGMVPGDPPNVAGWQAFRQTPQYYRLWISGDTLRNRNEFTDVMVYWHLDSDNDMLSIDPIAFAAQFDTPEDPAALVEQITNLLLPKALTPQKKFLLKAVLLSNLPNDSYWTAAWVDYQTNPADPVAFSMVNDRLQAVLRYLMRLPEFQLC